MSKHALEKGRVAERERKGAVLAYCRANFHYDPLSGLFVRIRTAGGQPAGTIAGSLDRQGYVIIEIAGRDYRAHRLAWLVAYGEWPADQIDHRNRVRNDNRLCNLRAVSQGENNRNSPGRAVSGYKGVSWNKSNQKWCARIKISGKQHFLGLFDDPRDAHAAYLLAVETLNNKE